MSVRRIIARKKWRSGKHAGLSFHDAEVAAGKRPPTFMASKRRARAAHGLSLTSSDMYHLHGKAI